MASGSVEILGFFLAEQHKEDSEEGEMEGTVAETFAEGIELSHSPTPSFGTADNFSIITGETKYTLQH